MKVFISWSKEKSRLTAEALNRWIPKVIQAVEPWISPDIEKGKRWSQEINENLEKSKFGILCLNQENLNEPWILFEAGAMAKTKDAHVCTLLLDITPTDVQQPLAQFNHTKYEKEDIKKLIHTINSALDVNSEKSLKIEVLNEAFEKYWGDLDKELKEIKKITQSLNLIKRSERELLEEILEILRSQQSSSIYFSNPVEITNTATGMQIGKYLSGESNPNSVSFSRPIGTFDTIEGDPFSISFDAAKPIEKGSKVFFGKNNKFSIKNK